MSKREKNMINRALLLIVFLLVIYSMFKGEDLSNIAETITEAKTFCLIMGVACVIFFIRAKSAILHYLFGILYVKTKRRTRFTYSSVGFFSNCITPSVGGGRPAQVYYMRRNVILVPVATVVLMAVTITYKLVLVTTRCLLVLSDRGLLNRYACETMPVFYLGFTLDAVFCLAMLILVFHTSSAKNIAVKPLGFFVRPHILKDKTSKTKRLSMTMDHYNDTFIYLRQHKEVLIRVMFLTSYQRTTLFSVTCFMYKTLGFTGTHMTALILLQSAISISTDMLPPPGGMGIGGHLFLTIFDLIFYGDPLLPVMVLSRGIVYYVQLVFNAAMTLIAHILIDKKQRRA